MSKNLAQTMMKSLQDLIKEIYDEADHAINTEVELQDEVLGENMLRIHKLAKTALKKLSNNNTRR